MNIEVGVRDEILGELKAFGEDVKELRNRIDSRHSALERRMDGFERGANRLRLSGGQQLPDDNLQGLQEERKALGQFVKTGGADALKSLSVGNDPEGGYIVLPQTMREIRAKLRDRVAMRRLARTIMIDQGDALEEPAELDKDASATWVGEKQSRPSTDFHEIGVDRWPLREIYALVPVTQKLIDLASIDVGAWVGGKIADKFDRAENAAFIAGDGVLKPQGILAYETSAEADFARPREKFQHVLSGTTTAITADALRNLFWTLRAPYREGARWLMSSDTANRIDLLKDGNGQYIWRNSSASGVPPTLLGKEVEFDEGIPSVSAGSTPIVFGDFQRGYTIVDHSGFRLLHDPYTAKPHVLFYCYKRVGGGAADTHAVKLLKIGEQ